MCLIKDTWPPITYVISLLNNPIFAIENQHDAKILATDAITTQHPEYCLMLVNLIRPEMSDLSRHRSTYYCFSEHQDKSLYMFNQVQITLTLLIQTISRWSNSAVIKTTACSRKDSYLLHPGRDNTLKVYYWNATWWWRFQSISQYATRR